jgi:hypothetical protein
MTTEREQYYKYKIESFARLSMHKSSTCLWGLKTVRIRGSLNLSVKTAYITVILAEDPEPSVLTCLCYWNVGIFSQNLTVFDSEFPFFPSI